MSQPFIPPPPPQFGGNPLYPPDVLASKAAQASEATRNALIFGLVGLVCFGFIFGFLAVRKASEAIEVIDIYQVATDKRGLAIAAKVLGIIDIVFWALALMLRIFMLSR